MSRNKGKNKPLKGCISIPLGNIYLEEERNGRNLPVELHKEVGGGENIPCKFKPVSEEAKENSRLQVNQVYKEPQRRDQRKRSMKDDHASCLQKIALRQ